MTNLIVGLTLLLIIFIKEPESFYSYLYWGVLTLGFLLQAIALESFFSKNIPKEVRGISYGIFSFSGLFGKLLCFKLGGILFEKADKNWPFIAISIFNFSLMIYLIIVIFANKL